ncbi:MAG: chorismate mutase [Ignavibacteria bacterium]|nr:chorismate mutase [Ignavibacteria bacterium]
MNKRIAIQGYEGSFHQEAAQHYFGKDISVVPCATFKETFAAGNNKRVADASIVAIENSIAGSILPNYNLLQKSGMIVTGEIYLQIRQQLMVMPETEVAHIREVHSHPMALLQCTAYLEKHGWKLVESDDTALSAKLLKQHHNKHAAAIASKVAAELYGLKIIARNIHTLKNNHTRFLILQPLKQLVIPQDANKASLYFETEHKIGSLATILSIIADGGVNLTKLQSFPIPGSDWKYFFHVDMEFNSIEDYRQVISKIEKLTKELTVYGVYRKGLTI